MSERLEGLRARLESEGKVLPDAGSVKPGRLSGVGRKPAELSPERASALRAAKREADRARDRYDEKLDQLYTEIRKAARAGASRRVIAAETGLTFQRVHQIVEEG
jgi:hypothetical protein